MARHPNTREDQSSIDVQPSGAKRAFTAIVTAPVRAVKALSSVTATRPVAKEVDARLEAADQAVVAGEMTRADFNAMRRGYEQVAGREARGLPAIDYGY
jgi:hypothetical protein